MLDPGFGEDFDRRRANHAAQNFSVLNRIAINLLKQNTSSKQSIHDKRLKSRLGNDNCYISLRI